MKKQSKEQKKTSHKLAVERLKCSDSFVLLTFHENYGTNVISEYKTSSAFFTLLCFMSEFVKYQKKQHENDVNTFLEQKYGNDEHDEGVSNGFFG